MLTLKRTCLGSTCLACREPRRTQSRRKTCLGLGQPRRRGSVLKRIIFALVLFCFISFPYSADAITRSEKQRQLDAIKRQMEEQKKLLAQKEKEVQTLAREIAMMDGQITQAELALEATKVEIDKTNEDIALKEEELKKQKKILAESIRLMYEEKETSLFETLLSSKSFSSVLDRIEYLNVVNNRIDQTIKNIEQIKADLQIKLKDLNSLKAEQEGLAASLNAQRQAKDQLLAQTQGQEEAYQNLLNANKTKYNQVNAMQAEEDYSGGSGSYGCVPTYFTGYFTWPFAPIYQHRSVGRVGCDGGYRGHTGIDFSEYYGAPILASASGTVVTVHNDHSDSFNICGHPDYGNYIDISHSTPQGTYYTRYAHILHSVPVSPGQHVTGGVTVIGYQGNTGNSCGSHLHFEIRTSLGTGGWVNPLPFLP